MVENILLGVKIVEDFTNISRKFEKITNKKITAKEKHIDFGMNNLRLQPKILTEMIVRHHLIIAYYMLQALDNWAKMRMQNQHLKHNTCACNVINDHPMEPP